MDAPAIAAPSCPRMYFVHIPKTGGVTLKTYLEDRHPLGASLAVHEREARALDAGVINRHSLWTGHYASEVYEAIAPRPDVTLVLLRHPVARLRSWAGHERRSRQHDYPVYTADAHAGQPISDAAALQGPARHYLFQSYWLARALRDGAASTRVPAAAELDDLLGRVTLVGLTEQLDRFLQLIAFRMNWPPPPLGWRLNGRPDALTPAAPAPADDGELLRLLDVDVELYRRAQSRFWRSYREMLQVLRPGTPFDDDRPADVPVETVQDWLRAWWHPHDPDPAAGAMMALDAARPISGEGWWWREAPAGCLPYRWSGPGARATVRLPPLAAGYDYDLVFEFGGAADWTTWDGLRVWMAGTPLPIVRECSSGASAGGPCLRAHARLGSRRLGAAGPGPLDIAIEVPATKPVPGAPLVDESTDTVRRDSRLVGVALRRALIARTGRSFLPARGPLLTIASRTAAG